MIVALFNYILGRYRCIAATTKIRYTTYILLWERHKQTI
jgi:hypothetical protein